MFGKVRGNRLHGKQKDFPPFVLNWKLIESSKKPTKNQKPNQTQKNPKQQQKTPKQQQKNQKTQLKTPGDYIGHTLFIRILSCYLHMAFAVRATTEVFESLPLNVMGIVMVRKPVERK